MTKSISVSVEPVAVRGADIRAIHSTFPAVLSRIASMFPAFALVLALTLGSVDAWGAWTGSGNGTLKNGVWYVVYEDSYETLNTIETGPKLTLSGPGARLTYDVYRTGNGDHFYYSYSTNNGSSWTDVSQSTTKTNTSYGADLATNVNAIRFLTKTGATFRKYISNVRVTMAHYIENPSKTSFEFGAGKVDDNNSTGTFTVAWCNVPAMTYNVTGTGADKISVNIDNNSEAGKYNTATFTITYDRSAASTLNATLTISDTYGSYSKDITLTGSTTKYSQTLSWDDSEVIVNMLNGTNQSCSATATSGLTVSYSSTSSNVLAVSTDGQLTAKAVGGPVTITASQSGNYKYSAATSITRQFYVKSKDTPVFTPDGFTNASANAIYVGDVLTLDVANVSAGLSGDFTAAYDSHYFNVTRSNNTISIEALNAGTNKTVVFEQTENSTIFDSTITYTFNISKIANTLSIKDNCEKYVGQELTDVIANVNSDGEISTSSDASGVAHYDIQNNKIVVDNASAVKFGATKNVNIVINQAETYKYTAASETITVTVKKYDNIIKVNGNASYSNTMYVDSYIAGLTLTSDNTDYTNSPISNTQTAGTDLATFYQNDKVVYSTYKLGTATWSLSQPENYKYKAGSGSFTVTVIAQPEATNCYVLTEDDQHAVGAYDNNKGLEYNLTGPGEKLYVRVGKYSDVATQSLSIYGYRANGSEAFHEKYGVGSLSTGGDDKEISISSDVTKIKFIAGGTISKWFSNVRVTRKTSLTVSNITINKQADASTLVYPATEGKGTLRIDYSLANGGNLKIACDNAKFKFTDSKKAANETAVALSDYGCSTNYVEVPVYYSSNAAGTDEAHIVVYNNVYRAEATITGTTVKRSQLAAWTPNTDLLSTGQELEGAYISATLPAKVATYVSSNTSVIRVDNNTKLVAVAAGKANITATVEGNAEYADAVDTKEIEVTSDLVQHIEWDQTFMNCKVGDGDRSLNAYATSDVECATNNARAITYSSSDNTVATIVNGNQLRVLKVGTAIITATQAGGEDADGHTFARVSTTRKVVVKDPNAPCEYYFYTQKEDKVFDLGWNAASHKSGNITLNDLKGNEPRYIKFDYSGEPYNVIFTYYSGNIIVEEKINNEWITKHELGTYSSGVDHNSGELTLDREATQIRITVRDGMGIHTIKNCVVALARYIETDAENSTVSFSAKVGEKQTKYIKLNYSEIKDNITLTMGQGTNSHFSVTPNLIEGDCGAKAKDVDIAITYSPNAETENENELLTISDGRTPCYITLNGEASKTDRTITWNAEDENTAYTIETIQLSASALTALEEPAGNVYFSVSNNSTTGSINSNSVLSFDKAGVAYVTANTVANDLYNAAPTVGPKRWDVSLTPTTIDALPTIGDITSGTTANAVELTGWKAINTVNDEEVDGQLSITSGDLTKVGNNTITLHFAPTNTAMFATCDTTMTVKVIQREATDDEVSIEAESIIYGQKLSEAELTNKGSLSGEFIWTDKQKDEVKTVGTYENLEVTFKPDNENIASKDVKVSVTVTPATPELSWKTALAALDYNATGIVYKAISTSVEGTITYSVSEGGEYAEIDATTGELTILVPGNTITVKATQAASQNYTATFITKEVTIAPAPPVYEFTNATGDNDWSNPYNWTSVPAGDAPDVVVSGALEIEGNVTVGSLTIESTGAVTVVTNGKLTVTGESKVPNAGYGDIHVEKDGEMELASTARVEVRNFTLDAKLGDNTDTNPASSGQVSGEGNMNINGEAYFKMSFDVTGQITYGWYDFVVPFEVDASTGVLDSLGNPIVYGVDYIIQEHSEAKRALKQDAWTNFYGTMQPGRIYTITLDDEKTWNTFIFKKKTGSNLVNEGIYQSDYSDGVGNVWDRGWNGFGNGTLQHREIGDMTGISKVQIYNHTDNSYDEIDDFDQKAFAVGTAFSIQVGSAQEIELVETDGNKALRAPAYQQPRTTKEFCLTLTVEDAEKVSDRLWVSASEEATGEYVIGRDLLKMGTPTKAKTAQMWAVNNGLNHCDIELPMTDNKAYGTLGLFAPEASTYILAIERAPEDATLYLTYNGKIIWNLTASSYQFYLAKGTTDGYGLRLTAKQAPQVATGVENADTDSQDAAMRKVIIDNTMYIITPEGRMFDAIGNLVR